MGGSRASDAGVGPDDYFEQLDTAFAKRGRAAASIPAEDDDPGRGVPTLDGLLSSRLAPPPIDLPVNNPPVALTPLPSPIAAPPIEPPETAATMAPGPSETLAAPASGGAPASSDVASAGGAKDHRRTVIADAFAALLALEEGEPGAKPVRLTTGREEPIVTDALVDEVARRVLQRLAPDTARAIVVEIVSEIAERLVREEIARIRSR
jgi:hypothetical protein